MKKIKNILLFICLMLLFSGCGSGSLREINYQKLMKMLDNKETFILEMMKDNCSACKNFEPTLKSFVNDNDIHIYYIDLGKINDDERAKLNKVINVTNTPTIVFVTNGEEKSTLTRIVGAVEYDKLVTKFSAMGYLKNK